MYGSVSRGMFVSTKDGKELAMAVENYRALRIGVIACALLLIPGLSNAQQAANRDSSGGGQQESSPDLANTVRALSQTVRELQAQVQSLNSQLQDMRAKE